MLTVTKPALWEFLYNGAQDFATYAEYLAHYAECLADSPGGLDEATFIGLKGVELRAVVADRDMSENHLGGDHLVAVAEMVRLMTLNGWVIVTWSGEKAESLIAGYRPGNLTVVA